jgi:glycine/D-amino acid oxidase-like deaminating enzyme
MEETALGYSARHLNAVSGELEAKLLDRSARLGVIGLGYVGLALATEMAKSGFAVTGIDIDSNKVKSINAGISYVTDIPDRVFLPLVSGGGLRATQSFSALEDLDAVSICVPTPLRFSQRARAAKLASLPAVVALGQSPRVRSGSARVARAERAAAMLAAPQVAPTRHRPPRCGARAL